MIYFYWRIQKYIIFFEIRLIKWIKDTEDLCVEKSKNILLLIFDENEERVEKLKNDYSLDDSSIVLMNGIEGNYEPIRKKLLEDNFV